MELDTIIKDLRKYIDSLDNSAEALESLKRSGIVDENGKTKSQIVTFPIQCPSCGHCTFIDHLGWCYCSKKERWHKDSYTCDEAISQ